MFERHKTRWVLIGIILVLGLVSVACIQMAPRLLPSLNPSALAPDDGLASDVATTADANGSAAAPTPGPGQALVKRGSITDTLSLNGRVAGADETIVTFGASGQVHVVDVKVGDVVQEGDTLMETDSVDIKKQLVQAQGELDTASIRLEEARTQADADAQSQQRNAAQQSSDTASQRAAVLGDAQAALHRAQTNLDSVEAGPSDSDIRAAQAAVTTAHSVSLRAEADLAHLQSGADPAQVRATQAQVDSAQADLDKAQVALDTLNRGPDQAAVRSAQREVDRATAQLSAAQAIPIDAKDPHADKARADKDASVTSARGDLQGAQDRLSALQQPPDPADVSVLRSNLQVAKTKLDAAKQALTDTKQGPDQASIDQAQATVDNAHLAEQNANDRLTEVANHPTPQELQAATDQVKAAQGAVDRANRIGTTGAASDTSSVGVSYNLVLLEKDVARNQALVDSLQQDLADSLLTAPFSGIVTKVNVHVDDKLTKDSPIVTLAKPGDAILRVDLTADEASKVASGQKASVKLDSINQALDATISGIGDPAKGQSGRTIQLKVDWQADAPPYGTSAQIQLQVNQKDGVLLVPKRAIHTAGQRRYVQIQSETGRKIANVDVGIVSSDSAEITAGLTEGQIVYVGL